MMAKTKERSLIGVVSKTAGLIDYQHGAVVSRTIIDRKTGTVTLFSFDKGQGLSEHKAPYDALIQVLDGKAKIFISGKPHLVKAGQMIILPANRPHALKALERFKMLLTMIRS
jgi:quercetin dioxygenase-like cupin family protein